MRLAFVLLLVSTPVLAQQWETQRALIERDQQSASFALQLRQSQEGILAPGDNRHLNERQRLDNLSVQQLQSVLRDTPQELRPYERQRSANDRMLQFAPPVVRMQPQENPRPLPAELPQAATPIGPAY
jgi:hypothetical protein